MVYATSFKGEDTEKIVLSAVRAGFKGLDTGVMEERYNEAGIREALTKLFTVDGVKREDLFIQIRVSAESGEDQALPLYNQTEQAIAQALARLGLDYADSIVLQLYPHNREEVIEAWRAMEAAVSTGLARQLGICDVVRLVTLR